MSFARKLGRLFAEAKNRESSDVAAGSHRAGHLEPLDGDQALLISKPAVPDQSPHTMQLVRVNGDDGWQVRSAQLPSSPIATSDRILFMGLDEQEARVVVLDRATGAEVWRGEKQRMNHRLASQVIIDGPRVYGLYKQGGAIRVDAHSIEDGSRVWRVGVPHQGSVWGATLLEAGRLLVPSKEGMVELEGATGKPARTHAYKSAFRFVDGSVAGFTDATVSIFRSERGQLLEPVEIPIAWGISCSKRGDDVVIGDNHERLHRYDLTGRARWTISLGLKCSVPPVTLDGILPRHIPFADHHPDGKREVVIVDLDEGRVASRHSASHTSTPRTDGDINVVTTYEADCRHMSIVSGRSGELLRVFRVAHRSAKGAYATESLRHGRLWLTGARAAALGELDWAVIDPMRGPLRVSGDVRIDDRTLRGWPPP